MKRFLRLLCALLCLALLPLPALGEDSAPSVRVLLRRLNLTGVDANTARLHLVGWLPSMPEKQRVCAELSVRD